MPIKVLGKMDSWLPKPINCCTFDSPVWYYRQSAKGQRSCNDLECES